MVHQETTEKLIISVQVLREQYDRARDKNRKLIADRRRIATEVKNLARYGCTGSVGVAELE